MIVLDIISRALYPECEEVVEDVEGAGYEGSAGHQHHGLVPGLRPSSQYRYKSRSAELGPCVFRRFSFLKTLKVIV